MALACGSKGPDMNVESLGNILSNLLNFYFPSYECSKILNYRTLYPNTPKTLLSISISKNSSDIKALRQSLIGRIMFLPE